MKTRPNRGFSLLEVVIATALFAAAMAVFIHFAITSQRLARPQPEAGDLNQRLRVTAGMIERDLRLAGAGPFHGNFGTLSNYLPPIIPARSGALSADPELTAFADRVSILHVPEGGSVVGLTADLAAVDADIPIDVDAKGCPAAGLCGFAANTRAVIVDTADVGRGYDLFSVTHTSALLGHGPPNPPLTKLYPKSTTSVVSVEQRVYLLDRKNGRILLYDGFKSALPLVDNVVDLKFSYFVDPHPASAPWPTEPGGNCLYGPGDPPVPLLVPLGDTLKEIPLTQLVDGPFCGLPPYRFDGDLLRIRRVRVMIRMQVGLEHLRGRGKHFAQPGSSDSAASSVKDFEVTLHVAPRNMAPGR
jgi:prepilin-type N-terminal cleavage/methylation domain-containing protein